MNAHKNTSPWIWIPTLYFFEGLPYFIVNTISILIFKDLGMDNGRVALLTSLIGLPWLLKPLWSPFVDIFRSKRWWIVVMQLLMAVSVALVALSLPRGSTFTFALIFFVIAGFASATHDISADGYYMIALDERTQSAFVGIRNTFYRVAMVFGQGVLVVLAGYLEKRSGSAVQAWRVTLLVTAGLLALLSWFHAILLPRPADDRTAEKKNAREVLREFGRAFGSFFTKPGVGLAIAFMLLFRLPEAFSVKMLYPFFSDEAAIGGLGLDKTAFGLVYGTAGVIALLAGGILGGLAISRFGLRKCLLPMSLSLALPCAVYLILALLQPASLWLIGSLVVFDQFGYGFGFTAYTVYMMRFADGPLKTSHYAICTGFMALSMLLPGSVAGYLQEGLGYIGFFWMVMACCLASVGITLAARRRVLAVLAFLLLAPAAFAARPPVVVKTGLEVLRDMNFEPLQGKRVGLVTNPTGVDRNLVSTVDILFNAPGVELVALFGPEHGVRGDAYAGARVTDSNDPATGVKVWSVYGKTRKPTPEMLADIDVMVYDIQDVGCRSYTFISTLGLVMEACAEADIEVMVLDRPNPLGGEKVEGCIVEPGCFSFISQFPIPYVYGLTVGELAMLLNEEGMLRGQKGDAPTAANCRLTVIPMTGWTRDMVYDETGLPWVLPSPHIPSAATAFYYPASGLVGELPGYLSVGVGYTIPFQAFAASWIDDPEEFCRRLNRLGLPGVRFRPLVYKPFYAFGQGETLRGVQFFFTDYAAANLSETGFYAMQVAAEMYPGHAAFADPSRKIGNFDIATGSKQVREGFAQNHRFEDIRAFWHKDEEAFRKTSSKYLLYR
ncbi:MAG: MFS transporter [Bacteroidales bacterium]|nr:MFS transporter [Bacteroidales bacterium]